MSGRGARIECQRVPEGTFDFSQVRLPRGYILSDTCLYESSWVDEPGAPNGWVSETEERRRISGAIVVREHVMDEVTGCCYAIIVFRSRLGEPFQVVARQSQLLTGNALIAQLADAGLLVAPHGVAALRKYLASFDGPVRVISDGVAEALERLREHLWSGLDEWVLYEADAVRADHKTVVHYHSRQLVLIPPQLFEEICQPVSPQKVAAHLRAIGHLVTNSSRRLRWKGQPQWHDGRLYYYAIKEVFLYDSPETNG